MDAVGDVVESVDDVVYDRREYDERDDLHPRLVRPAHVLRRRLLADGTARRGWRHAEFESQHLAEFKPQRESEC